MLAVFEMLGVLAGYLTGTIIDGSLMSCFGCGYSDGPFTLFIGLPTALASILVMGLPRVIISYNLACGSKERSDDESSPLVREDAGGHYHSQQRQAAPAPTGAPLYYTPHPNVVYNGPLPPAGSVAAVPPPGYYEDQSVNNK